MTFKKKKQVNVLVVEDNEDVKDTTKECLCSELRDLGYDALIDTASDGQEAIPLCKMKDYDIILVDMIMVKMNGKECIKKIRAMGNTSKIIMVTGFEEEVSIEECLNEKIVDDKVFYKPVPFERMAKYIKESLQNVA